MKAGLLCGGGVVLKLPLEPFQVFSSGRQRLAWSIEGWLVAKVIGCMYRAELVVCSIQEATSLLLSPLAQAGS